MQYKRIRVSRGFLPLKQKRQVETTESVEQDQRKRQTGLIRNNRYDKEKRQTEQTGAIDKMNRATERQNKQER